MALKQRFHITSNEFKYQRKPVTIEEINTVAVYASRNFSKTDSRPDTARYFYSEDGKHRIAVWAGLLDANGREFSGNIGFVTTELFERKEGSFIWERIELNHYMPLDWATEEIIVAHRDGRLEIECFIRNEVERGVKNAVGSIASQLDSIDDQIAALKKRRVELEKEHIKQARQEARRAEKQAKLPKSVAGFVYLLKSNEHVDVYKIGRTVNPASRSRTFGVQLPFAVEFECLISTPDMYELEAELHARFSAQRLDGEWFRLSEQDVSYIRQLGE